MAEGELVRWSTAGDQFVVQSGSTIDVYAVVSKLFFELLYACIYALSTSSGYETQAFVLTSFAHPRHTILSRRRWGRILTRRR